MTHMCAMLVHVAAEADMLISNSVGSRPPSPSHKWSARYVKPLASHNIASFTSLGTYVTVNLGDTHNYVKLRNVNKHSLFLSV